MWGWGVIYCSWLLAERRISLMDIIATTQRRVPSASLRLQRRGSNHARIYRTLRHADIGGFNVSNLMGIKRRMIDIGKKITFYFLQNVWKFAFAFKVCKKCYNEPKHFFLKNINMGIKKRRILCWLQIRWCRLKQMPLKKLEPKNYANLMYLFLCIFPWFFAFNFC